MIFNAPTIAFSFSNEIVKGEYSCVCREEVTSQVRMFHMETQAAGTA